MVVAYHASQFKTSVASFVYISKESWLRQNTKLNLYSELWIVAGSTRMWLEKELDKHNACALSSDV